MMCEKCCIVENINLGEKVPSKSLYIYISSGKQLHNYGKLPFLMGKSTISMAIFNSSYVSLPEISSNLRPPPGRASNTPVRLRTKLTAPQQVSPLFWESDGDGSKPWYLVNPKS